MNKGMEIDGDMVKAGAWVTIRDGQVEEDWRIVPHHEADALRRWISENSPLGRALLGHRPGEQVKVEAPRGRWPVTIVRVDWSPGG